MVCDSFVEMITLHIDGLLNREEINKLEDHLSACEGCRAYYVGMRNIVRELNDAPAPELPPGFHAEAAARVRSLPPVKPRVSRKPVSVNVNFSRLLPLAGCVLAAFLIISLLSVGVSVITGGNAGSRSASGKVAGSGFAGVSVRSAGSSVSSEAAVSDASPSLAEGALFRRVYRINVIVEEFEEAVETVRALGGYSTMSRVHYGGYYDGGGYYSSEFTRRIDQYDYDDAKFILGSLGTVIYENEYVESLVSEDQDLRAKMASKTIESERLTELLKKSETIAVMAAVEGRLSQVLRELDEIKGELNYIEDAAARPFMEITLTAREETPPEELRASFGERMRRSFSASWNGTVSFMEEFVVWFSGAFLPLLILGAVAFVIYRIYRRKKPKG